MDKKLIRKQVYKYLIVILLIVLTIFFSVRMYNIQKERKAKQLEIQKIQQEINKYSEENKKLRNKDYIKNEFRRKYNLTESDEKLINFPENENK